MQIVKNLKDSYSISKICKAIKLNRSSYYSFNKKGTGKIVLENIEIAHKVKDIIANNKDSYGVNRILGELKSMDYNISRNRLVRIKQVNNLYPKIARKFILTTDSKYNDRIFPNILNREFKAEKPLTKLVSDITYISTQEGWLYLATVIDLFNRKVIGYSMSDSINSQLITDSISMAFNGALIDKDSCIFHSDRGSQYSSDNVIKLLESIGVTQSMSRKGNCWDNAVAESFFKTLKYEGDIHKVFKSRKEAKLAVFEFIEVFYNRKRRHSALDYLTPCEFDDLYYANIS